MAHSSKELDRKFEEIENRLKNSFLGIKKDFELIDEKLKNSFLTIREDIQTINKKQDEFEKAYSEAKKLKKQLPEIKEALKQNSEIKDSIESLKEEIKKQDKKQTGIFEEYKEALEEQNAKNEAIRFKFKNLKNQLLEATELKDNIQDLKKEIKKQNKILEKQNSRSEATESEINDLKKEILETTEVFKQNLELKGSIGNLKDEIKKQTKEILEEQNIRNETIQDLKEEIRNNNRTQNKILEKQNSRNEETESEIKDLKKKLELLFKKNIPQEEIKKVSKFPKFKRIKISKLLIFLIPIAIIFYLIFMNIAPFGYEKSTFYDIGTGNSILTPKDRVSGNIAENGTSFQNLKGSLVYFDISPLGNTKEIKVDIRFKDNFPKNSKGTVFSLCAKDEEEWHYKCNPIYIYTKNQGGWVTTETTFNIKTDNLYIKDNKLNMMLNVPHLDKKEYINNTIPLDYINVTLIK